MDVSDQLLDELRGIEDQLREVAVTLDANGVVVGARLFETWAHTVALLRSDLDPEAESPGTLGSYLDRHYEDPPGMGEYDEGDPILDGGRSFAAQPETCPECGLTLDSNGECTTGGCPGPEGET